MDDTWLSDQILTRRLSSLDAGGVVLMNHAAGGRHWLYTIGNTVHGYPELLVFCSPGDTGTYEDLLCDLSRIMIDEDASPQPHRPLTLRGHHAYPIDIDRIFIAEYAYPALQQYLHAPKVTMLQLLIPDAEGRYPHEPDYTGGFFQPLLKCH
jgi:hypothetical protein